mmetsp:Transcript_8851/g.25916  ORF Transcript_8851/g.25916 Transcript_8851/m.25916 type:complete len:206 (+) Transcript_8851:247-864(+)
MDADAMAAAMAQKGEQACCPTCPPSGSERVRVCCIGCRSTAPAMGQGPCGLSGVAAACRGYATSWQLWRPAGAHSAALGRARARGHVLGESPRARGRPRRAGDVPRAWPHDSRGSAAHGGRPPAPLSLRRRDWTAQGPGGGVAASEPVRERGAQPKRGCGGQGMLADHVPSHERCVQRALRVAPHKTVDSHVGSGLCELGHDGGA